MERNLARAIMRGGDDENQGILGNLTGSNSGDSGDKKPGFFSRTTENIGLRGSTSVTTILIILSLFALVVIIVYIMYKLRNRNLKSVTITGSPIKLFETTDADDISDKKLVATVNGQEFSYTFWLYLLDFEETTSNDRLVFLRGPDSPEIAKASPVVFMDGSTNRLFVSIVTNLTVDDVVTDLTALKPASNADNKVVTAVVEYVPLQRWVNVTFTVQDNLLTVFLDGDMYSVKNVHDLGSDGDRRPVFKGTRGDVHVGATESAPEKVNGYISGLRFFNYTLMQTDAKTIYEKGPVSKSWLEKLGISEYGVQSPIYKIE